MSSSPREIASTDAAQRVAPAGAPAHVRYADEVEVVDDDETATIEAIVEAMQAEGRQTEARYGRAVRTSHAKSHGLARGALVVDGDLAARFRQGLFAQAARYPVVVRFSHVPGELLDDRKVSTPRGMAIKVIGVAGPRLAGHADDVTQDFVLDTGKVFPSPGPKAFLATIQALEKATSAPQGVKQAVSTVARATHAALGAVGIETPNLDFFGHPVLHPLTETYYSQTPYRYGDFIAKFRVRPLTPALGDGAGQKLDLADDENALRLAVAGWLRDHAAEYEFAVQLCTDFAAMPVENAHTEWPEDASPYVPVARLILPAQDAWSPARQQYVDELLSFCPANTLAAHRPLGGINRARLQAYEVMADLRRRHNRAPRGEPTGIEQIPD